MLHREARFSTSLVLQLGVLIFIAGGCVDGTEPSGPTASPVPIAPPSPSPPFAVSGVVLAYTSEGPRPEAGVPLVVHSWGSPGGLFQVTSDVNGRYVVFGLPAGAVTIAPSIESDYRAPCPSGTDVLKGNETFDVHVVSTTLLSTTGAPASMPTTVLWISGGVFERTPEGLLPIAGATVDLAGDDSDRSVYSTTLTDSLGRYLLCTAPPGTGTDQIMWIRVRGEAYRPASRTVFGGWDFTGANVELIRN